MNRTICRAIKNKGVVKFRYRNDLRTVEPQCHGISTTGKEVLRGFQTKNHSRPSEPAGERLFEVSKISDLRTTGETFSKPGPHYNPNDKAMDFVHCSLKVNKARRRDGAKLKQSAGKQRTSAGSKPLRYSEIKKQYPNEWVLVEFSKLDRDLHAKKGKVLAHASNKEDIYKAMLKTQGKDVSLEYFGPLPKDLAVMFCLVVTR